jgi:regulator of protease activity HflC (stomatin/prohibitin superfamily)
MLFVFFLILLIASIIIYRRSRNLIGNPIKTISPFAVGVFAILTLLQCFTVVPAGNVGVVDFFGMVSDNTLKAGINPVNPLAKVVKFSVKTQELKEDLDVPSKEGLTVGLEISVLFHLNPEMAASIYKTVGENYGQIILIPQFRSVCRGVTASYDARALYTSERELLAQEILKELSAIVEKRGINIESTPLRQVMLPPGLSQSIEAKLQAEQESQRMQFVLAKEEQEAQRKRIEAKGIADFQDIVARGISEPLLRWKGIEATEKLATSPNAKVVVIGAGKDGLPLILDTK